MGWVEKEARDEALLNRDGLEVWRDLIADIRYEVGEYTRIYSPAGLVEVEFNKCLQASANCIRVRTIPAPGAEDTSFELLFSADQHCIQCPEAGLTYRLAIEGDKVVIQDKDHATVAVEEVCKAFLKPLFAKLPRRKPNIILP